MHDPHELALGVRLDLEVETSNRAGRRRERLVVLAELEVDAESGHRPPTERLRERATRVFEDSRAQLEHTGYRLAQHFHCSTLRISSARRQHVELTRPEHRSNEPPRPFAFFCRWAKVAAALAVSDFVSESSAHDGQHSRRLPKMASHLASSCSTLARLRNRFEQVWLAGPSPRSARRWHR